MARLLLLLLLILIFPSTGVCASAGELGIQYHIRYANPIVIGPVKQVQQGILPKSPIVEAEEEIALEEGSLELSPFSSSGDGFAPFSTLYEKDLDETVIVPVDHHDLFSMLHINGARVSYQIRPLVHIPIAHANDLKKSKPRPRRR